MDHDRIQQYDGALQLVQFQAPPVDQRTVAIIHKELGDKLSELPDAENGLETALAKLAFPWPRRPSGNKHSAEVSGRRSVLSQVDSAPAVLYGRAACECQFHGRNDVRTFADELERHGLTVFDGQAFVDVAVVDMHKDVLRPLPGLKA